MRRKEERTAFSEPSVRSEEQGSGVGVLMWSHDTQPKLTISCSALHHVWHPHQRWSCIPPLLPGVAWRLGDRFLVSGSSVAHSSSSPWLKRNERMRQDSFPGTHFGSYSSRMDTGHAVWCGLHLCFVCGTSSFYLEASSVYSPPAACPVFLPLLWSTFFCHMCFPVEIHHVSLNS